MSHLDCINYSSHFLQGKNIEDEKMQNVLISDLWFWDGQKAPFFSVIFSCTIKLLLAMVVRAIFEDRYALLFAVALLLIFGTPYVYIFSVIFFMP